MLYHWIERRGSASFFGAAPHAHADSKALSGGVPDVAELLPEGAPKAWAANLPPAGGVQPWIEQALFSSGFSGSVWSGSFFGVMLRGFILVSF